MKKDKETRQTDKIRRLLDENIRLENELKRERERYGTDRTALIRECGLHEYNNKRLREQVKRLSEELKVAYEGLTETMRAADALTIAMTLAFGAGEERLLTLPIPEVAQLSEKYQLVTKSENGVLTIWVIGRPQNSPSEALARSRENAGYAAEGTDTEEAREAAERR